MGITERRQYERYPAGHLKVLIKSISSETDQWIKGYLSSVDFNRYGIGLETEYCFPIGEIVTLFIRTDDSTLTEVKGIVCNRQKAEFGFRCGIRFQPDILNKNQFFLEQQNNATLH